ncbi:MAG: PZ12b [Candidatus Kaiserbacteria bacterium GW2011_GWC2_52_8b]|uniref:PZ12b n=2 Tax=Candidatus Kaiseribacteriota TaxID=1752734 RepID=A0A0G1XH05_9BACT|nr:MAG: PZ12b [Candidatus Kaiserbacteria bacterium GW2011_GWA2_52_12]KKW30553.1 MAG: PZ12b [Candidatus Kaiserbacteria bacterium GW2011_GWC2_52_8b]
MRELKTSTKFRRSIKKVSQYRNFDEPLLGEIIMRLRRNETLDPRFYDHELKGEYAGIRECHVKNDLLLLYQKKDDILVLLLILIDIGTHTSVFGK